MSWNAFDGRQISALLRLSPYEWHLDAHTNNSVSPKRDGPEAGLGRKEPSAVRLLTLWLVVVSPTSLHLVAALALARSLGFPRQPLLSQRCPGTVRAQAEMI